MGIAKVECATCGGSMFESSGVSYPNGMIALECSGCHAFVKVTPPIRLLREDGLEDIVTFEPGSVVKKERSKATSDDSIVTVVLKMPKAVRSRFRKVIDLARQIQDCTDKGMYSATVFEYMVEEFIQSHEHEAGDANQP